MPRTGRPPQPTALKLARGERRPSRVNYDEPSIPAAPAGCPPPGGLDGAGLAEWRRIADMLTEAGALRESDLVALEDYCRALSELRRFEACARKAGPELAIAKGYQGVAIKLRAQANTLRRELGLTPSSRGTVRVAPKNVAKESKIQEYMRALPGGRA